MVVKERELAPALERLSQKPRIVITDSQAFRKVAADTPDDVLLTSFSILFARYKGDLAAWIEGIRRIETLADGDRILIAEACTHHVQSDDIGTVKIPRWLREATGKNLVFEKCAGNSFPADLAGYALVIHCGGCMINRQESLARIGIAAHAGLPITNYGLVIAWCFGILRRALAPFPHALAMLDGQRY
jgi:[FeFe] hydrogenase H-cluster maturation GTPase HydF